MNNHSIKSTYYLFENQLQPTATFVRYRFEILNGSTFTGQIHTDMLPMSKKKTLLVAICTIEVNITLTVRAFLSIFLINIRKTQL